MSILMRASGLFVIELPWVNFKQEEIREPVITRKCRGIEVKRPGFGQTPPSP
jgi:hypothetical protein